MSLAANNLASPRVNLLPAAYEMRCRRTRRLRRWFVLGGMLLALQVVAGAALREMSTQTRDLQQGLLAARQQEQDIKSRLQALAVQQNDLGKQIELADHLNRKHRWSELLNHIATSLPDTIVLTRCESDPPRSAITNKTPTAVTPVGQKAGAQPELPPDIATGLLIAGVATDHDSVARLLRNLNTNGTVGRCMLESTQRQPFLNGVGVFFTIRTQW